MPFATMRFDSPSEYIRISEDYQRIMGQQAQQNAERAANQNQMWSQAVGSGVNQLSSSIVKLAELKYNERKQLEGEARADQRYENRRSDEIDWQVQQQTGFPSRAELDRYSSETGQSYPQIAQQQQNEAILSRTRMLANERMTQELTARQLEPIVADQQTMESIRRLPPPLVQSYQSAQMEAEKVRQAVAAGEFTPAEGAVAIRQWNDQANRVVSMAQQQRKPTPDEELAQSYATKDGNSFVKGRNGTWTQVKEDSPSSNKSQTPQWEREMMDTIDKTALTNPQQADEMLSRYTSYKKKRVQADIDARTVSVGARTGIVQPNGTVNWSDSAQELSDDVATFIKDIVGKPTGRTTAEGDPIFYTEDDAHAMATRAFTTGRSMFRKDQTAVPPPPPKAPATQPSSAPASAPAKVQESDEEFAARAAANPDSLTPAEIARLKAMRTQKVGAP